MEIESERRGLRPKTLISRSGRFRGGSPFARGQLHHLLTNPNYIGRIRHNDQIYPCQHTAVINDALWQDVQSKLIAASARPRGGSDTTSEARILAGKLRDETGDLLTPTHTQRHGRRFAYYVSNRLIAGGVDPTGWRLPAEALETCLRQIVISHLRRAAERHAFLAEPDATEASILYRQAMLLLAKLEAEADLIGRIIVSGSLEHGELRLRLDASVIAGELAIAPETLAAKLLTISQSFALRRRGIETKIIAGDLVPSPDLVLQQSLAEAHAWARDLRSGK